MRTGAGILLIGAGAILAFAVTTNTSVFNLHTAGYVLMLVGILGLVLPRKATGWMGRRLVRRRYGGQLAEDVTYTSYDTPQDAAEADVEEVAESSGEVHDHAPADALRDDLPPGTDYSRETIETQRPR